jgi:hypothetical protein
MANLGDRANWMTFLTFLFQASLHSNFTIFSNEFSIHYQSINPTVRFSHNTKKSIEQNSLPSIGVTLHRWGEITQSLKSEYLCKSHCKSCEQFTPDLQ